MSSIAWLSLGVGIGVAFNAWKTFWIWHRWRSKWRVKVETDHYGITTYVARGSGSYSNRTKVGPELKPEDNKFYEKLHQQRAIAEERARELNDLEEEIKVT